MRERVGTWVGVIGACALASCFASPAPAADPAPPGAERAAGAVRLAAGHEDWKQAAPPMPPTARVALVEGDPSRPGPFTMRIKLPAGFALPPHTHATTERTTVISGVVYVGLGAQADKAHAERLGPGSFYLNPKDVPHFLIAEEETVLQVIADGPWETRLLPAPEGAR